MFVPQVETELQSEKINPWSVFLWFFAVSSGSSEYPIAVGGFDKENQVLTSVEIFYIFPKKWALTHPMPRALKFNSIVNMLE